MSDSLADNASRKKVVVLVLVASLALVAYLVVLRQWPAAAGATDSPSMLLPLLGFSIALCAGIAVGAWWPSIRGSAQTEPAADSATEPEPIEDVAVYTDDTPTVSALMEEEHIPGQRPSKPVATEEPSPVVPPEPEPEPEPAPRALQHASVSIDDRPRDEAMSAKDEVIRSLENIVKENRDRWASFEQEREALDAKIANLESELRIAHQIIENGGDDHDVFVPPQVLERV